MKHLLHCHLIFCARHGNARTRTTNLQVQVFRLDRKPATFANHLAFLMVLNCRQIEAHTSPFSFLTTAFLAETHTDQLADHSHCIPVDTERMCRRHACCPVAVLRCLAFVFGSFGSSASIGSVHTVTVLNARVTVTGNFICTSSNPVRASLRASRRYRRQRPPPTATRALTFCIRYRMSVVFGKCQDQAFLAAV